MKIAFLNIYSGVVDRGAETFVEEVATRLADTNDVCVFQAGDNGESKKYRVVKINVDFNWSKKSGEGSFASRLFIDYWSRLVATFTVKTIPWIMKERFDVIVPVNGGWQVAIVRIVTWLYGGKLVVSGQSGMGWDDRNNLWGFPDTFVALSTKAKLWAKKANPFIKVKYIPNGVDINKFTQGGEKIKIKLKKPIILCVGALTKTKRIDLTIKAVARLKDTSLLVVGDGDLWEEIVKLGKESLGARFELMKVPFKCMPEVYRVADVFTLASQPYYSFEIVLTEAMASGLPVVADDDPIRKEIIGEAGILVNPIDINKYTKALKEALNKNWENIPRFQAEKFSWDEISQTYEKLFKSLI